VYSRPLVALAGCRYLSTHKGTPPPTKPTPPPQAPAKAPTPAAQAPPPAAQAPPPAAKVQAQASGAKVPKFNFYYAQPNLPLRLYSKSGSLASYLYAYAEFKEVSVDKVRTSLELVRNELVAHPKLNSFLANPVKTPDQKAALLAKISALLNVDPLVVKFLDSLAKIGVTKEIVNMVHDFDTLIKARDHIVDVDVTLFSKDQPTPKPESVRKLLNYGPEAKITLNVSYDSSIAGGAILSTSDRYLDFSFQKELQKLRDILAKQQVDAQNAKKKEFMLALSQYENAISP